MAIMLGHNRAEILLDGNLLVTYLLIGYSNFFLNSRMQDSIQVGGILA